MRPERRFKPGVDGGLTAASLFSPLHHLRTLDFLSKRWGPPHRFDESMLNALPFGRFKDSMPVRSRKTHHDPLQILDGGFQQDSGE